MIAAAGDTYVVTWEGPALWQIFVAVLAALQGSRLVTWSFEYLADWWAVQHSTVEDPAPAGDGPVGTEVRFRAQRPEGWQAPPAPQWWATQNALHTADCQFARRGEPLPFVLTVEEAAQVARDDGLRACRHCKPLSGLAEPAGDLEGVRS